MKLRHLFFILLALCTVFFLAGCDSGGGSSSSGGGNGDNGGGGNSGTMTYVVTGLINTDGTSGLTQIEGGIRYTDGYGVHEDYATLTVNETAGTFTLTEKEVLDSTTNVHTTFTGTFTKSGSTINATITHYVDHLTSTEGDQNQPETFTINNNTITGAGWAWIFTQQ